MSDKNPLDWLLKADRDYLGARTLEAHVPDLPDLICYHCQQAGEKYLKSLLAHHRLPLLKTHDLEELLDVLKPFHPSIEHDHLMNAVRLNAYTVGIRYPTPSGDPTTSEVFRAFAAAEFFRDFAKGILGV